MNNTEHSWTELGGLKKIRDNERKGHVMNIHKKCCQSESLTCLRSVVFIWQWIDTYTATSSSSFGRQPLFIWPLHASPAYGRGRGLWSQKLGCQRQPSPVGSPGAISVLSEGPGEEWFRNPCWREQERDDALPKRGLLGPHCGATPRDGEAQWQVFGGWDLVKPPLGPLSCALSAHRKWCTNLGCQEWS